MAKIVSLIQYVGKAGNTVGQKGPKGGIVFKQLAASVANPRTDAQMRQRAKMKLAAQVAGMLGEVGRTALIANSFRKTDRGTLYSEPITLTATTTVKAIALKNGLNSSVATRTFTKSTGGDSGGEN